ncbi:unnamed protein product [Linum trigynum]|uniref:Ubiquitin-like protease family profile domain-containing protein n=1 Tax=Linum trigynum TaxID=586398 RepID=A0AAV2G8J8_9ROSI
MYLNDHYQVCVADIKNKKTFLFDSIKPNAQVAKKDHGPNGKMIFGYAAAFLKEQGVDYALDKWPFNIAVVPQQVGNDDCSVLACLYMEQ